MLHIYNKLLVGNRTVITITCLVQIPQWKARFSIFLLSVFTTLNRHFEFYCHAIKFFVRTNIGVLYTYTSEMKFLKSMYKPKNRFYSIRVPVSNLHYSKINPKVSYKKVTNAFINCLLQRDRITPAKKIIS